jgi:hypothetical protein
MEGSVTCGRKIRGKRRLEAVMAGVVIAMIIAPFVGLMTGVIAVVALSVRREDRRHSLAGEAPDRMSRSARRLNGVSRRDLDAELFRVREAVH